MARLHVVMLAAEAAPLAKAGGLADVVGALPPELEALGIDVSVVIPHHRVIDSSRFTIEDFDGAASLPFGVKRARLSEKRFVYLIGSDQFFGRSGIYVDPATGMDYPDQADRWIFFQRSALEFVRSCLPATDVLHC